jgi:Flp pilus assembly protein TadG
MSRRRTEAKRRRRERGGRGARGAQLLELSLALPVLMLLVAGILDFGSTFALKAKLTNASREAARIVVSTPLTNFNCKSSVPCPIQAAVTAVVNYMGNAGVDASCLDPTSPSSSTALSWTFTCRNGASLEIDRGAVVVATSSSGASVYVPATRVTFGWPVQWKVANFLRSSRLPSVVSAVVTMANLTGSS